MRQLKVELIERTIGSAEELRASLRTLRRGEADAFFYLADAMVLSQAQLVIEAAMAIGLPTMFADTKTVAMGGLAGYGPNFHEGGRISARHVRGVLLGAKPGDLPVEQYDRLRFVINLKTAKALGLALSEAGGSRADEVLE